MTQPHHPDTIILKNQFYPKGLKEIDIWNYYQSVKPNLLKEVSFRDVFFFLGIDNKLIVQRYTTSKKTIRLNKDNYDTLITGRTISIHSEMTNTEDFGIIDIDCDNFDLTKKATIECNNFLMSVPLIQKISIRYTGKTGFHIKCTFGRKLKIDSIKYLLEKELGQSKLSQKYTINRYKRVLGIPNLDLAPMKYKGGFITLHSLSVIGLRCMEVPLNKVLSFNPKEAIIKT